MTEKKNNISTAEKTFFIPLLLYYSKFYSCAAEILNINKDISSVPVGKYVYLYNDVQSIYKDSEIIHISQFQLQNKDIPVSAAVTNGNIWAKFKVVNSTVDSIFFLNLQYSNISELSLYKYNDGRLQLLNSTGNDFAFEKRTNTSPDFVFPIRLPKGDTSQFFLKIHSSHPLLLPLFIKSKDKLDETR